MYVVERHNSRLRRQSVIGENKNSMEYRRQVRKLCAFVVVFVVVVVVRYASRFGSLS